MMEKSDDGSAYCRSVYCIGGNNEGRLFSSPEIRLTARGRIAASGYAAKHPDTVNGVVLLTSYSTVPFGENMTVCSVYGSEDGCLSGEQYSQNRQNLPETAWETVLRGGDHAQFGDYGEEKGDGTACMTPEEQQTATVREITACFRSDDVAQE